MRLNDDVRKLVVFLGERTTDENGNGVTKFGGTGFFVSMSEEDLPKLQYTYLVTAKHVAEVLPMSFAIGFNSEIGNLSILDIEQARWYLHEDDNVDIAVMPLALEAAQWVVCPTNMFADFDETESRVYLAPAIWFIL